MKVSFDYRCVNDEHDPHPAFLTAQRSQFVCQGRTSKA